MRLPLEVLGTLGAIAALTFVASAPAAMTKEQIRDRSAEICRNGDRAMQPHDDRAMRAANQRDWNAFVRHARRSIRIGRRHIRRLGDLKPPAAGRARYLTFVEQAEVMVRWLDAGVDAIAARRFRRAAARIERAEIHQKRAVRAARRYPLRRACIRFLN
jgi:hypothetical protein